MRTNLWFIDILYIPIYVYTYNVFLTTESAVLLGLLSRGQKSISKAAACNFISDKK